MKKDGAFRNVSMISVFFAALIVMAMFPLSAEAPTSTGKTVNKAAAIRSLEKATGYLAAADWSNAEFEARLGLSYDPALADFPYVEALARASRNAPRADILVSVEHSLSAGLFWRVYDRDEAAVLCARLYAETCRYNDALSLLSTLKKHASADEDYVRVCALYGLSRIVEARKVLSSALTRWPFDSRFARVFLSREADHVTDPGAIALASSILSRLYLWQDQDRSLLLLAVPFETDPATRERDIRVYRNMGKNDLTGNPQTPDPLSAILALEYGVIGEKDAVDEVFSTSATGINLDALLRLCKLAGLDGIRKDIATRLQTYEGIISIDENGDGFVDSRVQYRLGRPVIAVFDRNQDGYSDLSVTCELGAPSHITGLNGDPDVVYDAYPFVRTVSSGGREYTLLPVKLGWAPVVWKLEDLALAGTDFYTIRLTCTEPALTERLLVNTAAFWIEPDSGRKDGMIRVVLENGVPVSSEASVSGTKYRWTSYSKGFPSMSKEDRDGDSYFETTTMYGARGALDTVLVDRNANRTVEYRERYASDGTVTLEWDSDENGEFEISYSVNALGAATTVWLNPVSGQPVTCVTEKGKPRSVTTEGVSLSVLKDPLEDLWWIGRIPQDSRIIVKTLDEIFNDQTSPVVSCTITVGSRRVQAVRTGGIIFAELLDE